MKKLIGNNPIIQRYRFSSMRPKQFWMYAAVYIIVVLLLLFINIGARVPSEAIFTQILVFQLLILWVWSASNTSSAIREENADQTYDFFRMLPLSAHQKAVGIMVGKNLVALLFVGINFVLLILFALPSVGFVQLVQLLIMVLSVAFCANTVSLLSSIKIERRKRKSGNILLLLLLLFMIPALLGGIGGLHNSRWGRDVGVSFYIFEIPILLLISSVALYVGCWAYAGIIRKFIKEKECLFTRRGAVLFLLGCEVILLGIIGPQIEGGERLEINYAFWIGSLFVVMLISFGAIRTYDNYWDKSRMLGGKGQSEFLRKMFAHSNSGLAILLFSIWALFSAISATKAGTSAFEAGGVMAVLLLSYMFLVLLIELWALYRPDSENIGVLLSSIFVVYIALPMICAIMFDKDSLMTASPFGLIIYLCEEPPLPTSGLALLLVYHIALCIFPAVKVRQHWLRIRETRELVDREQGS